MKFCIKFFREINFETAAISPCCNTHAIKIPAFSYTGGPINLSAYGDYILKCIHELQQPETTLCAGCPDLVECGDINEITMVFNAVSINMHRYFCNCKCVYCDFWKHRERGRGYEVLPALKNLHEQNMFHDKTFISWGGGEPSILPEFDDASAWALNNGYYQIVHTSAIKYSPVISKILKTRMGCMNVSLDSASSENYQKVKGLNAFNTVFKNIVRYCHEGDARQIILKYIIFDLTNNIKEIEKFLRICKELNIKRVDFSFDFREVTQNRVSDTTIFAAAWFKRQAEEFGLKCNAFFVDKPLRERVEKAAKRLS